MREILVFFFFLTICQIYAQKQHSFFVNLSYEPIFEKNEIRHANAIALGYQKKRMYAKIGTRLNQIRRRKYSCVIYPVPDTVLQIAPLFDHVDTSGNCTHSHKSRVFILELPIAIGWKYIQKEKFSTYIEFSHEPSLYFDSKIELTPVSNASDYVLRRSKKWEWHNLDSFSIRTGGNLMFSENISILLGCFIKFGESLNEYGIGSDIRLQYDF